MRISFVLFLLPYLLYGATIEEAVRSILKKDPTLVSYRYETEAARLRLQQAKDRLYPTLDLQADFGKDIYHYNYPSQTIYYDTTTFSYDISLRQSIFDPKIYALVEQSEYKLAYAKEQEKYYANQLLQDFLLLYGDALYYKNLEHIYQKRYEAYEQIEKEIEARMKLKMATVAQLSQAHADVAAARSDLEQARYYAGSAKRRLELYAGEPVEVLGAYAASIKDLLLPRFELERAPKFKLASINEKVALVELKRRKKELYPTFDLSASYSDTDSTDSITRRGNKRLFVQMRLPLFNKQAYSAIHEAEALYRSAAMQKEATRRELIRTSTELHYNAKALRTFLQRDEALIEAKAEELRQLRRSFAYKLVSLGRLSRGIGDYYDALAQRLQHQRQIFSNAVRYHAMTGGLIEVAEKILQYTKE